MSKEKKAEANENEDGTVFGDDSRETKRVKLENADPFGPPL
jgi:cyclin H